MKWANRISSLFLIVVSIIVCFASVTLGIGEFQNPGPGLLPFYTSLLLFFLSLMVLIKNLIAKDEGGDAIPLVLQGNLRKPASLIISLIGYVLTLNSLGYIISTSLLIFIMLFIFDSNPKKWWKFLIVGVISANLSFLIFNKWLQVQLPIGLF
jgi:putative tricarboxylic transport membrane protein